MKHIVKVSRRGFLQISAASGTGLVLGIILPGCSEEPDATSTATTAAATATGIAVNTPIATAVPKATDIPVAETATPMPEAEFEPNIYLKIDETGQVTFTAFRSEMGQGIRTALAMIAAEELDAD